MKLRNIWWRMNITTISSHLGQRAVQIEHSSPCLIATIIVFITVSGSMAFPVGGTKAVFRAELAKFPYLEVRSTFVPDAAYSRIFSTLKSYHGQNHWCTRRRPIG